MAHQLEMMRSVLSCQTLKLSIWLPLLLWMAEISPSGIDALCRERSTCGHKLRKFPQRETHRLQRQAGWPAATWLAVSNCAGIGAAF